MADIGVLNLTIKDNSEQAVAGLGKLTDALGRVRDVVSSVKISPVANSIKRLATAVNQNLSGNTITKIRALANELEKLKGLGNLNIKISGGSSIKSVVDTIRDAGEAMGGINTGFEDIGARAFESRDGLDGFNDSMRETVQLMQNTNWNGGLNQFREMFEQMSRMRMMFSLPAGEQTGLSTEVEDGWTSWREGAIEVEGTVSDAMDSIAGHITGAVTEASDASDTVRGYLTGIVEEMKEVEKETEKVQEAVRPEGYGKTGSIREIYASTTGLGPALRAELGENEKYRAVDALSEATGMSQTEIIHQLTELGEEARKARGQVDELMNSLNKPLDYGNLSQGIDRMLGIGAETKSAEESMSAFLQGMKGDDEISRQIAELNPELASVSDAFTDAQEAAKYYEKEAANAAKESLGLKESFQGLKEIAKGNIFLKLGSQLGNIAKRMAMRALIRQMTSALKEGIENVYRYSQAVGTSFAPAMDSASTSLLQMKNSIGAALAPAIQAIIPYINQLVSRIIEVINYVNQMFALLNGQSTWTRAVPYATKAFDDQKKSAKGAHEAMKDLLADWDELNIIQSQSGGGGGGSSGTAQEDYAAMFEEVSHFDDKVKEIADVAKTAIAFVKDHFLEILGAVKLIKWGIKMMKFSNAFTGTVGKLLSIAASAMIIKMTLDVVTTLDNKYVDTGKEGWLVADVLMTALGAGIAGKLVTKTLGTGFGVITAGLTFAFSAGATFAVAENAQDEARKSNLNILGMAKLGFAAILSGVGLAKAGFGIGVSAAGGILITGLAATIKYLVDMDAEQKQTATAMAKAAFAGGEDESAKIDPDKYLAALQTELDTLTQNAKLIMNVYIDVPNLKAKFDDATAQLKGLSAVVAGSDKLTEEDAKAFKAAWKLVTETLDEMNTKTYSTLLQGITNALGKAVGEAKDKILELRKEFIKLNEGLDEKDTDLYLEMEEIVDKLSQNNYADEEERKALLERYGQLSGYFTSAESESKYGELNKLIESGATLDFSKGADSVEEAKKYIEDVKTKIDEVNKTFDDAEAALRDSYEHQMNRLKRLYENDLITEEDYLHGQSVLSSVLEESLKPLEADRAEAAKKIDEAYKLLFDTMFKRSDGTTTYWKEIILPLMEDAKKAGAEIPKELSEEFTKSIVGNLIEFDPTGKHMQKIFADNSGKDPKAIAEAIQKFISQDIRDSETIWEKLGLTKSKYNEIIDISEKLGFTGFDILTQDLQKQMAKAIRDAFGEKGEEILKLLGYDTSLDGKKTFEEIMGLDQNTFANMAESFQKDYVSNAIKLYGDEAKRILKESGYENLLEENPIEVPAPDTSAYEKALAATSVATHKTVNYIISELARIGVANPMTGYSNSYGGGGGSLRPWLLHPRASGGFVKSGDLVLANENGNFEMMGKMGNQPVVANNQQIVSGITQGVSQANNGVESRLTTIENLLTRILQKEFVAKAVPGSGWGAHNARSNLEYGKVTGVDVP